MQYVRFVYGELVEDVGYRAGFLDAAYRLRNQTDTPHYVQQHLTQSINWFKEFLPIPTKFNRSSSKGAWRRNSHGLSWFKSGAHEHINQAQDVLATLEANGIMCDTIRADRIGYVIYEDQYQVVAEPFSDTPK